MSSRLVAIIDSTKGGEAKVKHYLGLPPELTDGVDMRQLLHRPWALFLEEQEGGFFLHRIDEMGRFLTDTWHQDVDEAKEQALFEYGDALSRWYEVPANTTLEACLAKILAELNRF